ncbi:MAG TPA: SEL1-like repeat protein [Candidatus Desulfovibrio intestinigallinarum]|nr:SEL1-like repeat protein [Candidatus Desulfovibrio intestinigallinarum]
MPRTKDTTQKDAAMQDAELFFQAADHRHLFLYIDGLAETEARRQADVCNYVKKHLDDYEALQKKVERLEQELQQKKDACALLQKQLAQQNSEAAVHSSQKTTTEDKQAGTAPAQDSAEYWYRLGEQYACGIGVPRDDAKARQWYTKAAATFKKAAEQGDADAQYRLGTMYKEGKGVPRNDDMSCQWYAKAAAQGHEAGLNALKQLAEQGHADAQLSLGNMYANGIGVPRDGGMARQWDAKAARQSHKVNLSVLKQLAEQGHADAQFRLGDRYKEGKGVPRDGDMACQWYAKAVATLKKAAEQGNDDAQYRLGTIYKEGKGVPQDYVRACQWYAKAAAQKHEAGLNALKQLAEQRDAEAQFRLGDMYKEGKGVPRDDDRARQWYAKAAATFKIAAKQGYVDAQLRLGDMYKEGRGVPRDDDRACQWYAKAAAQGYDAGLNALTQLAEQGNADAQYCLGCMYRKGEGLLQDYDLARRWFEKAIAQGHADALNDFGKMY